MKKRILSIAALLIAGSGILFLATRPSLDMRRASALAREWRDVGDEPSEREALVRQAIKVSSLHPETLGGLVALRDAVSAAGKLPAGQEAVTALKQRIETDSLELLADCFPPSTQGSRSLKLITATLLLRVKAELQHPSAHKLLCAIGRITAPSRKAAKCDPVYVECASLIEQHFADQSDLFFFTEQLAHLAEPSAQWAIQFEPLLRKIIEVNPDRASRCSASFALARALQAQQHRQDEAEDAFATFCSEFDGSHDYHFDSVERNYYATAEKSLSDLRNRRAGMEAPALLGEDLDGQQLSLRSYRGKAVLISFWATWCSPCLKMIEHERELLESLQGRPFAILGVNADDDLEAARKVRDDYNISWRSLVNKSGNKAPLSAQWEVLAFPTIYLIDHHGIIRKSWKGTADASELRSWAERLVDAAELGHTAAEMYGLEEPVPTAKRANIGSESDAVLLKHVQEHRVEDGSNTRFSIYVPRTFSEQHPIPLILFLHGSGARGRDSERPLGNAMPLLRAVHRRSEGSPVFVLVPQAEEEENWTVESQGGQRAMAVLDQIMEQFPIDPNRIALTGLSMGGEGTWSLAANHPDRFAAIIPICHGGNPNDAAQLASIPCWCFHGAADPMIHVSQSRKMIKAINDEGGRAIYSELAGVGHEEAADHAYMSQELFDWILEQRRRTSR